MFTINITTDDPAVLIAIGKAVKNLPPEGFTSVDAHETPEVTIHAAKEKIEEAAKAVNVKGEVKVVKEETPKPEPIDPRGREPEEIKEIGQRLRQALLGVSKLDGKSVKDAKDIAAEAAGVPVESIGKDFPSHPKALDAIAALEALL